MLFLSIQAAEPERQERVRVIRPPSPPNLTLKAQDKLLSEVTPLVLRHFGLHNESFEKLAREKDRRISLSLEDASLWQALDVLCGHLGLRASDFNTVGLPLCGGVVTVTYSRSDRFVDAGEIRVSAELSAAWDGKNPSFLGLTVFTPPGHVPAYVRIDDLRISGEKGREISFATHYAASPSGVQLYAGNIGKYYCWTGKADVRDLGSLLSLTGKAVVVYPKDVEAAEVRLDHESLPKTLVMGGTPLSLLWESLREDIPGRHLTIRWDRSAAKKLGLFQVAHLKGDQLVLFDGFVTRDSTDRHQQFSIPEKDAKGVTVRILRYSGEDPVTLPFAIERLPVVKPQGK